MTLPVSKTCSKCNETKPLDAFHKQSNGPFGRASRCKECTNRDNKERYDNNPSIKAAMTFRNEARRQSQKEKISNYKLEKGCTDCGYNKHPEALHFDHLPGHDKLFNIGHKYSRKWDAILKEIAKCEVVCANCHAIRTADRRNARE